MDFQNWSWFALNFQWIGFAIAIVLLLLLFFTNVLRGDLSISKWKDYTWISWLGMVIYLIHNVEEYGFDLFGRQHEFPNQICTLLHTMNSASNCPSSSYFLAVNVTAFWVLAPLCALISKKHPFAGLAVYAIIFVNTFFHIMPLIATRMYNPGFVTTILLFIPISIWLIKGVLGNGAYRKRAILYLFLGGIMFHLILTVPIFIAANNDFSPSLIAMSQVLNSAILFAFFLWADKNLNKPKSNV